MKLLIFTFVLLISACVLNTESLIDEPQEEINEIEQYQKCSDPVCYNDCLDYCHSYPAYDCGYGGCWRSCCN